MSVPFSNTHLRVPRGFGAILEGLAREILRDQPEDIPTYAAHYFASLLKQREDSGVDPAEWAARLEDRFYNNHAFKTAGTRPETAAEVTISKEKSESQTEDESSHSAETSHLSTTQPNVSEKPDVTESTDEEEKLNMTEEHTISAETGLSEEESHNRFPIADIQSDEPSGTDEEKDPTITTLDQVERDANETDSSAVPHQNILQSELEPTDLLSFSGISEVDVCAQELVAAEDKGGDEHGTAGGDEEIVDSEGEDNTEVVEPVDMVPYSGLADVNVCAAELGGTERTVDRDDTHVEDQESLKAQSEETALELSQSEITEGTQQEAEDQADNTKEEERTETEASVGETHDSLAHIESVLGGNVTPKEESLVEISFEDVPDAQQIAEAEGKHPEEEGSIDVIQTEILEMQQKEESTELTASMSDTQDPQEPEMEGVEAEVNPEGEEMESDITKEKVDTNESNVNDSDDNEKDKGVEDISSSDQPTTETEKENQEEQTDHKDEGNERISEAKSHLQEDSDKETQSNDPDYREDETTDTVGGDREEIHTEGYSEMQDEDINDGGAENNSSQVAQSNTSMAVVEAERETFEESAQHVPEENEESQRTLVESQPEDQQEVTSREAEERTEGMTDSEVQEKSEATHGEENLSLTPGADRRAGDQQGEGRPVESEKDVTELADNSSDKEECSRPQEEEDIMDIPLDDPEANRAAAKIQAGFRGHMTRKKMKPEDKAEGEEVSSTGDVLNGSQGDSETGRSGAVEGDDTSVPEQ